MNLLLVTEDEISSDGRVRLEGRRARHLQEVLRVEVGGVLRVGVVRSARGRATVRGLGSGWVDLELELDAEADPPPQVDLLVALPRPKAVGRLLETAAAFGVGRIDLVNAWRVDRSYFSSPKLAHEQLCEHLRLGCEQGGSSWVPDVQVHRRLMPCLEALPGEDPRARVVAHPGAAMLVDEPLGGDRRVLAAVGPEGGWIQRELDTLARLGFRAVSLSRATLRTEIAVACLLSHLEVIRHGRGGQRGA